MVKVQIVSDLHLDYHRDGGKTLVKEIHDVNSDVLIIAGDVSDSQYSKKAFELLLNTDKIVLFVAGNHEYFNSSFDKVDDFFENLQVKNNNFRFLNNKVFYHKNIAFAGTTLWYPELSDNYLYEHNMWEFSCVSDFKKYVYKRNQQSIDFINHTSEINIMITHHLPSRQCIDPKFSSSSLNRFFVCPILDDNNFSARPKSWVYGHTHASSSFKHNGIDLYCNPFGNLYEQTGFRSDFVIHL